MELQSLHPRIRSVWLAVAFLGAVVLTSVLGGALAVYTEFEEAAAIFFFVLLSLFGVYQWKRYSVWGFEVREDNVYLRYGVLVRVQKVVPFVRIQHIDSRRSPVERATGLASLVIYTAGSRGADVRIPGLLPEQADELREELKDLAIEDETRRDDAV